MKSKSKRIALYGVFAALLVVVFYLETLIGSFWVTPPGDCIAVTSVYAVPFR